MPNIPHKHAACTHTHVYCAHLCARPASETEITREHYYKLSAKLCTRGYLFACARRRTQKKTLSCTRPPPPECSFFIYVALAQTQQEPVITRDIHKLH